MRKDLLSRLLFLFPSRHCFVQAGKIKPALLLVCCLPSLFFSQPDWAWSKNANTPQAEFINDLAVDTGSGEIIAVGVFNSDLSAFYGLNFTGAAGGGFVAKYDATGNVLWAFPIGNNQDDACSGVATDGSGNIYVTGYLQNIADFKGTSGTSTILSSAGLRDAFLAKYNSAGQLQWVKKGGGAGNDEGKSVCVSYNKVFITGYYNQSVAFGSLSNPVTYSNDNGFVLAYDLSGNELWLSETGSSQNVYGNDVTADSNNVFLTAGFKGATAIIYDGTGTAAFTLNNAVPGQYDAYMVCYTAAGGYVWSGIIHSSSDDSGNSIAEKGNQVFVTGAIESTATFPGYVSNPVTPAGNAKEFYITALDKVTGNTNWVITEAGSNNDQEGMALCMGASGEVLVAGYFDNQLSFGGGPVLFSFGNEDVFVAAYSTSGIFQRAVSAGSTGTDIARGVSSDLLNGIYTGGEYADQAAFGAITLPDDGLQNVFLAQIACLPVSNNTISSAQTICEGTAPSLLIGSSPSGGSNPFSYYWQQSTDSISWSAAAGTDTTSNYSPPVLNVSTYYRRIVVAGGACTGADTSAGILITVNPLPDSADAGTDQIICGDSTSLSANTPVSGTGSWSFASGAGSFSSVTSPASVVDSLSPGINHLVWTISSGACPKSIDTVIIKSFPPNTIANAGADQATCLVDSVTLNANIPLSGNGSWNVLTPGPVLASSSSANTGADSLVTGQNLFEWVIANSVCPDSRDTVIITVYAPPAAAGAGTDQAVCGDSASLSAATPVSGNGTWSVLSGNGSFSDPASPTSSVDSMNTGMNVFLWTISNGPCTALPDTVVINSSGPPAQANAGPDQQVCASSAFLNGNFPASGSGSWNVLTAGPTVNSPAMPNSGVNSLVSGPNSFEWVISNGVCPDSRDTVVITVDLPPSAAAAGTDQNICGDSTTLNGNTPLSGTGNWSVLSGAGNFSAPGSENAAVTGLNTGLNLFIWTISSGACPPSSDTVVVNAYAPVTAANAGADQAICASSSVMNANTPASGAGTWNVLSPGPSLSSPGSPVSGVSSLPAGQNSFEWVISNGICPDSRDTMIITVSAMPTAANAGTDQVICGDSASLSANVPVSGSGTWSVLTGSGNFSNAGLNSASVTGITAGNNTFVWSIASGVCPVSSDTVVINSYAPVTPANAGTDQFVCSATATLNANTPASGTGNWNSLTGGASFSSSISPVTTVSALGTGQNSFEWLITNGVCPDSRDTVIITVDAMPTPANAGADQNVCGNSVVLGGNTPFTGTGQWSIFSGAGSFSNAGSGISSVSNLGAGSNVFVWSVSNGVCPPSSDTVVISSLPQPTAANAGADQEVCDTAAVLSANTPANGTGSWNILTAGPSLSSLVSPGATAGALVTGQNSFEWVISNGVCPDSRDTVIITSDALPTLADAGPDIVTELNSVQLGANTPVTGSGSWSLISGQGSLSSTTDPAALFSGLQGETAVLTWTIVNGVCPASSDTLQIFSNDLYIPQVITPNGDGKNDAFEIKAYHNRSGLRLELFNRWGARVFFAENYQNNFDGHNMEGTELAEDTYFYVMETDDHKLFKGYLIIKRR